jgi:hemoglobin
MTEPPSLYEWAGGADALERLTTALYREVLRDDLLEPLLRHMEPGHPARRSQSRSGAAGSTC